MKTGIAPGVKIRWIIKAFIADRIRKKYPNAAKRLQQIAEQYNRGVALAEKYEAQGRVLIIAPDDTCGIDTLSKKPGM